MTNHNNLLRVILIKPFLFLWLAEIFSQISMNMINFILIVLVFKLTNSNTAVAGVILAFTIPSILFGIVAGVYTDHWDKKNVLFITNMLRALLLGFLMFYYHNLFFVYIVTFTISLITQFFVPAETPLIPELVPEELLLSANALFGMGIYSSVLVAYALSGPSLIFFGDKYVFLVLIVCFLIASIFVAFISRKNIEKEKSKLNAQTIKKELRHAFSLFVKSRKISSSILLLSLSQLVVLILAVVGPSYAQNVLGATVESFPLIFVAPAALGMVIGAVILGNFTFRSSKEKIAAFGVLFSAIGIFILPFMPVIFRSKVFTGVFMSHISFPLIYGVAFLAAFMGVANAAVFVPSNTILQEETKRNYRGKLYGLLSTIAGIISLLPIIIVGRLADIFGVQSVLIGISGGVGLIGIWRLVSLRAKT